MEKNQIEEHAQVKVAKISATQAVIVALITSLGGVTAGYFVKGATAPTQTTYAQRWLVLKRVEGSENRHIRLVASVNGVNYSYPSRAVWAEMGPQMSPERFPLPVTEENIRVSFSAFVTDPGSSPVAETVSHEVVEIKQTQLPTDEKIYKLYPMDRGYRGANPGYRIYYSVE